jgi:hypothetical protein
MPLVIAIIIWTVSLVVLLAGILGLFAKDKKFGFETFSLGVALCVIGVIFGAEIAKIH